MPVTFAAAPANQGRRPSASSPFPGRIMTSLAPSDPPKRKHRTSSSASSRLGSAPLGHVGAAASAGAHPASPVFEESGIARADGMESGYERATSSPQEEPVPLYCDADDAERQPLLGGREVRSTAQVQWLLTLSITAAVATITFLILFVWRLAEEETPMTGPTWSWTG